MSDAITTPSEDFAASFGPLLDKLPAAIAPFIKKATDDLYCAVLEDAEAYIRSNVEWNIGNLLDRREKAEALNVELLAALKVAQTLVDAIQQTPGNVWQIVVADPEMLAGDAYHAITTAIAKAAGK